MLSFVIPRDPKTSSTEIFRESLAELGRREHALGHMAFKVFDAYGAAARPEATLRASGQLFLSRGILRRSSREDATHYQLQFDEETDRLAIKLCHRNDESSQPGVKEALLEKSGIAINVVPLLRYYNFRVPKAKMVMPVTFESDLVVVELKGLREAAEAPGQKSVTGEREDFDDDIPF